MVSSQLLDRSARRKYENEELLAATVRHRWDRRACNRYSGFEGRVDDWSSRLDGLTIKTKRI